MMSRGRAKAQGTQHGGADRRPHTATFAISALSVAGDMRDWGNGPCDVMRRNFAGPMARGEWRRGYDGMRAIESGGGQ